MFGIKGCLVFDVVVVCVGFIYVLSIVDQYVKFGVVKYVLVVGFDVLVCICDSGDCGMIIIFGDGVGVVVLSVFEELGIIFIYFYVDGCYGELLILLNVDCVNLDNLIYLIMVGNEVFKVVVIELVYIVDEMLVVNNLDCLEFDWLVLYQVNLCIISVIVKKFGMLMDNVVVMLDRYGNIFVVFVLCVLDEVVCDG